jgi:2'-5' RNA ligase
VRLFVAVWPSPDVVETLSSLARPELAGVRWTTADQWHVTLRFDGDVAAADVESVVSTLANRLAGAPAADASCDGTVRRFGRGAVGVVVEGLGDLAGRVDPSPSRPFRGHLTLARFTTRRPPVLEPPPPPLSWPVSEVTLVRSHLGRGPARYEVIRRFPLGKA